jgi:hypothetical protein
MDFKADFKRSVARAFKLGRGTALFWINKMCFWQSSGLAGFFCRQQSQPGDFPFGAKFASRSGDETTQSIRSLLTPDFTVNRIKNRIRHFDFPAHTQSRFGPASERLIKDSALILHY